MSDDRGRKRDTPTGIGPVKPRSGQPAPRGAGLSGRDPRDKRDKRDKRDNYEPIHGATWDSRSTPPRGVPEPPRPVRSPPPPSPPPRSTVHRAPADAFAKTRPAEVVAPQVSERAAARGGESLRPGASASAGSRPLEPHKPSLRLKLDSAGYDESEGRVRVPKRRAPMLLGMIIVFGTLGGGALLWIEAHGGVANFVQQLERVASGEPATPVTPVQQPPAASAPAENPPGQQAAAPTTPTTPGSQPTAAAAPPQANVPSEKPADTSSPQIATGEVEAPDEAKAPAEAAPAQPKAAAEAKAPPPKAAAKPAPKPAAKPRPVQRAERREPVLKIQEIGDGNATDRVLGAAPPDPGGGSGEMLPPPDPPAPE